MNTFENLKKCQFCYWLSVYDIIESMNMEMMINSPQIMVVWSRTIQPVSVPNLKSFRGKKKQIYGPKDLEKFLSCFMGK